MKTNSKAKKRSPSRLIRIFYTCSYQLERFLSVKAVKITLGVFGFVLRLITLKANPEQRAKICSVIVASLGTLRDILRELNSYLVSRYPELDDDHDDHDGDDNVSHDRPP